MGWALAAALGGVFLAFGAWFFGEVSKAFGGDEFPQWIGIGIAIFVIGITLPIVWSVRDLIARRKANSDTEPTPDT